MLIPGGHEKPQRSGGELYGRDGIGWGVGELVLCCELSMGGAKAWQIVGTYV